MRWLRTVAPETPFPADQVELGEFLGRVAVLLLAGGRAAGDDLPDTDRRPS
jgi:hypothetical protein